MTSRIFERIAEQALEEAKEDEAIDEGYDLTGASRTWGLVYCARCRRIWLPRVPEPKQCRWCHSRGWRTAKGTVQRGRPPVVK